MLKVFQNRIFYMGCALIAGVILTGSMPMRQADAKGVAPVYTGFLNSLALGGYDPVAYFKDSKPVEGSKAYSLMHEGVEWRFSSAENRAAFIAAPSRYAPQFGGYCSWAVSRGYTASGDPEAWHIENGKLYLNYSKEIRETWRTDIPGNIALGDVNWPRLLKGE